MLDDAGVPEHMAPTVAVIADADKDPVGDAAFSIHLGETDDAGRVVATIAAVLAVRRPARARPARAALHGAAHRAVAAASAT